MHTVCCRLNYGADLGYTGPRISTHLPNNLSARSRAAAVTEAINAELARGHTAGPYPTPPFAPFRCNPLGARDKPDGSIRLILDLSQPGDLSVNSFIERESFTLQYINIDQAIAALFTVGPRGALMAKADLKHAFRLIPVKPDQWWLLGFCWNGQYYHDVRLAFGLRSACSLFNDLAEVLCQALAYHSGNSHVYHYLDDLFFFSRSGSAMCAVTYDAFLSLCATTGVPIAADKCSPPSTRMTLLGCILDTEALTISLPDDKVQDILHSAGSPLRPGVPQGQAA